MNLELQRNIQNAVYMDFEGSPVLDSHTIIVLLINLLLYKQYQYVIQLGETQGFQQSLTVMFIVCRDMSPKLDPNNFTSKTIRAGDHPLQLMLATGLQLVSSEDQLYTLRPQSYVVMPKTFNVLILCSSGLGTNIRLNVK